jgi:RimJ/RimL family protein N-acetyltransferase
MALCPIIEGFSVSLKNVKIEDNLRIVELRNSSLNSKYINPTTLGGSHAWIKEQQLKENDYYFSIVSNKTQDTVGFIGIYNFEFDSAEWGRWVVDKNPVAALESLYLIMKFGFEQRLENIYCRTRLENKSVVNLHSRLPYTSRIETNEEMHSYYRCDLNYKDWDEFSKYLLQKLGRI